MCSTLYYAERHTQLSNIFDIRRKYKMFHAPIYTTLFFLSHNVQISK